MLLILGLAPPAAAWAGEIPWSTVAETVDSNASNVADLVAADLDQDGDLDLAGAGADGVEAWFVDAGAWSGPSSLFTGGTGRAAVAADFDGNGLIDVAAGLDAGAYWLENGNGGAGQFFGATALSTGVDVRDLAWGDLDGDGDPDLVGAVGGASGSIRWWENTPPAPRAAPGESSRRGEAASKGAPPSSSVTWVAGTVQSLADASGVAVADLDGDGDLDIAATADGSTDDLVWFENTAGDASAWTRRDVDTDFDAAHAPFVADLDGDGNPDLGAAGLAGIAEPVIGLWLSDGTPSDGGWTADTEVTAGEGWVRVADLDDDGDSDLAQASADRLDWWENAGDGATFLRRAVATPSGASAAFIADIDFDGDLDLLASSRTDSDVSIWSAETLHRSASFARQQSLDAQLAGGMDGGLDGARSVDAADFDGDGDLDVVASAFDGGEVLWWRNEGGAFVASTIDASVPWAFGVRAGDVDGDGDPDVVGALGRLNFNVGTNKLVWWENVPGLAKGSLAWTRHEIETNINSTGGAADPWPLDMDLDGDLDILLASAGTDRVAWWENTAGDGSAWTERLIVDPFNRAHSVVAADVDGDGDPDVVASADTGDEISWWRNGGAGASWVETSIVTGWDGAYDVWVADLDGDGDMDVLGASQFEDRISFWRNDGTGGFGSEETLGDPLLASEGFFNQAYSVETGDLDGDGDTDIVGTAFKDGGKIAWWENLDGGATMWARHAVIDTFDGASSVHVADVDGDGRDDLLATAEVDDRLALFFGGGGQFALPTTVSAPPTLGNAETEVLFTVELEARGLASEGDVELASIELLFEEAPGDPLTTLEVAALIDSLEILGDDGTSPGAVDAGDTVLVSMGAPPLVDGVAAVVLPDGAPEAAAAQGASATLFVRVTTTADFESQGVLGLRVSHLTGPVPGSPAPGSDRASRGEERSNDVPLRLEWAANASTPYYPIADQAALAVTVGATSPDVVAGGNGVFTVTVTNSGPAQADAVQLVLAVQGEGGAATTAGCAEDPAGLPTCSLGDLASGSQTQVTVTVATANDAGGPLELMATVSSSTPDPSLLDNDDSGEITVIAVADLGITKTGPTTYEPGIEVDYEITVTNPAGPGTVEAQVADPFTFLENVGWTCVGSAGGVCASAGAGPLAEVVTLPPGGQVVFQVTGRVVAGNTGSLTSTAGVIAEPGFQDPNLANNQASASAAWVGLFTDGFEGGTLLGWSSSTP